MPNHGYSRLRKNLLDAYFVNGEEHVCPYCSMALTRELASLDHEPPVGRRKRRRSDIRKSTVLACRACNSKKGKQSAAQFRAWLASKHGRRWVTGFYCPTCNRRWGFYGGPTVRLCPRCGGDIDRLPSGAIAERKSCPRLEHGELRVRLDELARVSTHRG